MRMSKVILSMVVAAAVSGWPAVPAASAAGSTPSADLAVSVADSPDPVTANSTLTYTITVSNAGQSSANVTLTNDADASMAFKTATSTQGSCAGTQHLTCTLGPLAKGAKATVTVRVSPRASGTFSDTAAVTGDVSDPRTTNDATTATTTVRPDPRIATTTGSALGTTGACVGCGFNTSSATFRTHVTAADGSTINEGSVAIFGEDGVCVAPVVNGGVVCTMPSSHGAFGYYHAEYGGSSTYQPSASSNP